MLGDRYAWTLIGFFYANCSYRPPASASGIAVSSRVQAAADLHVVQNCEARADHGTGQLIAAFLLGVRLAGDVADLTIGTRRLDIALLDDERAFEGPDSADSFGLAVTDLDRAVGRGDLDYVFCSVDLDERAVTVLDNVGTDLAGGCAVA